MAKITAMPSLPKNPVIGIVGGRGRLGGTFARALTAAGHRVLISGRQANGQNVLKNAELIARSDVVFIAVPLASTPKILAEIVPQLRASQLVADLTSVKAGPVAQLLTGRAEVVGLHPLFGQTEELRGQNVVACPARAPRWWPWLRRLLNSLGLRITVLSPARHDQLLATTQAAPHLLLLTFAQILASQKLSPAKANLLSSPSSQLLQLLAGRLLGQDLQMYTQIQLQNPAAAKVAAELAERLTMLARQIAAGDSPGLLHEFQTAATFFGQSTAAAETQTEQLFATLQASRKTAAKPVKESFSPKKSEKNQIAILGPGTQTALAAKDFLLREKISATPIFFPTNDEVAAALLRGAATLAVLPLENYTVGPVRETVKNLFAAGGQLQILATLTRPIHHALLGHATALPRPTRIFAHPQARAQCQQFLQKNFAGVEVVETPHTGESVARAAADATALALGPAELAAEYGVAVLQKQVEDDPQNCTRFVLLGRRQTAGGALQQPTATALAFFFTANKAGQLAAALAIFARCGISLSRLESIPVASRPGEFFFFTECAAVGRPVAAALAELAKIATVVNFGSYRVLTA